MHEDHAGLWSLVSHGATVARTGNTIVTGGCVRWKHGEATLSRMDTERDPGRDTGSSDAPGGRRTAILLREEVYLRVRRMALTGEFPFWQRLPEVGLAEHLGVSRTPVREALARLAADGILSRFDDGGYYVAEPNLVDLRDLYELRITLELRGILRAKEEGVEHDAEALAALHAQWQQIRDSPLPVADGSFIELDESFHVALSRASGNLILTETLETVNARIRAVRMHDFFDTERIDVSITEHLGIVEAVQLGEIDEAAALLRNHIGASLTVVEDRVTRAMTRMMRLRRQRDLR